MILGGVPATAQQLPPIRQIGGVVTTTAEKLGAVSTIRHLSDGKVLVNDIIGRRVLLFDSTLKTFKVVADTTSATGTAYGPRPGGLIPFRGDSTLFVDPASLSMLVIDGSGKIARVMSAPRANDANFLVGGPFGSPGFDPNGRLIYRSPPRPVFGAGRGPGSPGLTPPVMPDSAPLIRVDLVTRKVDTLAFFKTPRMQMTMTRIEGGFRATSTINPLPVMDDWGVLPDGTVALVRGRDYHIDWITPDKSLTSTAKIPFEWERLSDEAKVAYVDSSRKAMEEARASGNFGGMLAGAFGGAQTTRTGPGGAGGGAPGATAGTPATPGTPATSAPSPGGGANAQSSTTTITTGGNTTVVSGAPGAMGSQIQINFVEPSELPDYKPPFLGAATRVDAEGNLWIRTTQNVNGRAVYNVVNRKGELIDRVQLPVGRIITGFGAGGYAYLGFLDGGVARLEKVRIK